MKKNNSIIYWKWEDATLISNLEEKIEDLCSRTEMEIVFIALHWVKKSIWDQDVKKAVRFCAEKLHSHGRKLYLELCARNEGSRFRQLYPGQTAYLTRPVEIELDESGRGSISVFEEIIPHYWRENHQDELKVMQAYIIEKTGVCSYTSAGRQNATELTELKMDPDDSRRAIVTIDAGSPAGGKTAVVFLGNPQVIPDLASPKLTDFYESMLKAYQEIPIDGVCSDEWGYDVQIQIEDVGDNPDFYSKKEMYLKDISYSEEFASVYQELCKRDLKEDLLDLFYDSEIPGSSIAAVNRYHKTMRHVMCKNEEEMYQSAKHMLGANIFYGVHPTWWGNDTLQNFEGFKNGFYWWEAKRDIAQTDEIVLMPIRTALAHKWRSPFWYNMWYSMGTRQLKTYFKETWNNVRFGGRTHYLAYECPNEAVVLELKPEGVLEQIEEMDSLVRMVDPYQQTTPDCRVLLLFSMQNVLNWNYNIGGEDSYKARNYWYPKHKVQYEVLKCADEVFKSYLCDLVPTSEIENGSLKIEDGKAVYGTQSYDAVILLAPDSMDRSCYSFLSGLQADSLMICGNALTYDDAVSLTSEDQSLLADRRLSDEIFCPEKIIEQLEKREIAKNRFEQGSVLQDGSLVFTAEGEKAAGNPLNIDICHNGQRIQFSGEDLLYLQRTEDGFLPVYSNKEKSTLTITEQTK